MKIGTAIIVTIFFIIRYVLVVIMRQDNMLGCDHWSNAGENIKSDCALSPCDGAQKPLLTLQVSWELGASTVSNSTSLSYHRESHKYKLQTPAQPTGNLFSLLMLIKSCWNILSQVPPLPHSTVLGGCDVLWAGNANDWDAEGEMQQKQ